MEKEGEKKEHFNLCFFFWRKKGTGKGLKIAEVDICRHMQTCPSLKAFHSHIFVYKAFFFKGKNFVTHFPCLTLWVALVNKTLKALKYLRYLHRFHLLHVSSSAGGAFC